jgi:hypothetical protein
MNQIFLTDVINWVGVAVGVLGAVIVAPSGFSEFARQLLAAARRILPRRTKNVTASANLTVPIKLKARGYGHVTISANVSDHELVHQLMLRVDELGKTMVDVQQEFDRRHDELGREIRQIKVGGQRSEAEIRKLISERELQNAKFNARGLPLIALGIVMTGPTGILAESAPVGWIFVALGICSMLYGVWPWSVQMFHRTEGAADVAPV